MSSGAGAYEQWDIPFLDSTHVEAEMTRWINVCTLARRIASVRDIDMVCLLYRVLLSQLPHVCACVFILLRYVQLSEHVIMVSSGNPTYCSYRVMCFSIIALALVIAKSGLGVYVSPGVIPVFLFASCM